MVLLVGRGRGLGVVIPFSLVLASCWDEFVWETRAVSLDMTLILTRSELCRILGFWYSISAVETLVASRVVWRRRMVRCRVNFWGSGLGAMKTLDLELVMGRRSVVPVLFQVWGCQSVAKGVAVRSRVLDEGCEYCLEGRETLRKSQKW
jgi:hypothetical protein